MAYHIHGIEGLSDGDRADVAPLADALEAAGVRLAAVAPVLADRYGVSMVVAVEGAPVEVALNWNEETDHAPATLWYQAARVERPGTAVLDGAWQSELAPVVDRVRDLMGRNR